jgi:hypothetical protein
MATNVPTADRVSKSDFTLPTGTGTGEDRIEYWCGTVSNFPIQCVHIAGVEFPKNETPPLYNDPETGLTERARNKGVIVKLTPTQAAKVLKMLKQKAVRWLVKNQKTEDDRGFKGSSCRLQNVTNAKYVRHPNDEPLAKYIYFMPVSEIKDHKWRSDWSVDPPTVFEMAKDPKPNKKEE